MSSDLFNGRFDSRLKHTDPGHLPGGPAARHRKDGDQEGNVTSLDAFINHSTDPARIRAIRNQEDQ